MSGFAKQLWLFGAVAFIVFSFAEMHTAGAGGRYSNFGPWDHRRHVSAVSVTNLVNRDRVSEAATKEQQAPHRRREDAARSQ
jgi:hypothetical protein